MSTSQPLNDRQLTIPDTLTSAQAKLVYLSLNVVDEATATELQQSLGLSKLTLFAILESLREMDLIQRTEGGYAVQ